MTNNTYNANLSGYKESAALQRLLEAVDIALHDQNERFESDDADWLNDQIIISIAGVQTAFYLGGPQVDAIYAFVQHIADENGYEVDINRNTVTE